VTDHGVTDEQWAEFVRNHRTMSGLLEHGGQGTPEPEKPKKRRRPSKRLLGGVGLCALIGLAAYGVLGTHPRRDQTANSAAAAPVSASASAAGAPSAAPTASSAPRAAAPSAGGPSTASGAAPLSVFAPQLAGYTLVTDKTLTNCTTPDVVGPTLAGLITQGGGCQGMDVALYRDQAGNQYNLALFSLNDPAGIPHIITQLASDPTDFEVGTEIPPGASGLRSLPADSGMVQSFAAYQNQLLVALGQWSDGHVGDYNTLVSKVSPLSDAVMKAVGGAAAPGGASAPAAV
jgi:hypothetical protein